MTNQHTNHLQKNNEQTDTIILTEFPYPIAVNYQRLLDANTWRNKISEGLKIYEFGLRTVTLVIINQYLNQDINKINDESFNQLLINKLPETSLGDWVELFFRSLQVYEGKQELFFTPELYEIIWDTSHVPHAKRNKVQGPFRHLVELRNNLAHLRLADTEENAKKVLRNLQAILVQFAFIRKYDLIHITEKIDDEECRYDVYRGQTIKSERGKLKLWQKGAKQLHPNWFYLMRKTSKGREVLELHPFLVAWISETKKVDEGKDQIHNIAIYDRLLKTKVTYINLSNQEPIEYERPILDRVRSILHYEIEELRIGRGGGKIYFSWMELKVAAQELSERNMKAVQEKYSPELYLQREETFQQFNSFLKSDKTGFVLTGKSGVGKSNFVLSLADAYAAQDKICYLIYDGARLSVSERMQDTISQDLGQRLELVEGQDVFTTLKKQAVMADRKLLVVFDAINENVDGKELLQKIDKLVDLGDDFPWLKVVITSRPQAWRTLKRGLHLAQENYYQPEAGDDLAVEMPEFAIKLEEFERGEVELAYEKYRVVYNLQTAYKALPVSIRETLRDPLVLRLVADIYRGSALPGTVRVSDIYEKYVDKLVESNRLEQEDIIFLEQEIVARMLSANSFDNKLTTAQIAQAKTGDGRPLWEMIRVSDQLGGGQAINASYQRLANAEILIQQGSPTDYEVSFKYERFYDYYGGKRLRELASQEVDGQLLKCYERWIVATREHPFLWGSIQSALLNELKQDNEALIINLCQTDEQLAKDMMVATLTDYGQEELRITGKLRVIEALLQKLMAMGAKELTLRQRLMPFLGVEYSQEVINAKKTAVDVATNIGSSTILEQAVLERSATVRNHAVLQNMNLWEREKAAIEEETNKRGILKILGEAGENSQETEKAREKLIQIEKHSSVDDNRGFIAIRRLNDHVRSGPLPNIFAAQSAISMLLYLSLTRYNTIRLGGETALAEELRQLARDGLDKLLYLGNKKGIRFAIGNVIRQWVISAMVAWTNRTVNDTPEMVTFNGTNIGTFLRRPRAEKEVMFTITRCMNSRNTNIAPLEQALPTILELNEGCTDYALQFALIAQWEHNRERVLDIATTLFEEGMKRPRPDFTAYVPLNVLGAMLIQGRAEANLATQCFEWWQRLTEKARGRVYFSGNEHLRFEVGGYFEVQRTLYQQIDTQLPRRYVQKAVDENDIAWMKAIINALGDAAKQQDLLVPSLEVLAPLLRCQDTEIQSRVINLLARLRRMNEYVIDDFMVENELSHEFQTRVKTAEIKGAIGGVFLHGPGSRFIIDAISYSDELQQVAIWIVDRMVETNDFDVFINFAIKRIVNLIYGQQVFKLPD